jgi:hypothetical protein
MEGVIFNNEVHILCSHCEGTGKEMIWEYSSNSSGTSYGRHTRKQCVHCKGEGYTPEPVKIVELVKNKRGQKKFKLWRPI